MATAPDRIAALAFCALCLPACALASTSAGSPETGTSIQADATAAELDALASVLASSVDPRVADVMPQIDGVGARLLALRSYLRSGERLGQRWSWTQQQIAAFAGSPEQLELDAEIQRVRDAFEHANPGYQLFVNPQVRSLDAQLRSWNRTESVASAAAHLLQAARDLLAAEQSGDAAKRAVDLRGLLIAYQPEPIPTVAAPGLSPHGQMRAVDFQVHRGGEIVAGPDTRTIAGTWEQDGWAARLDAAVSAASRRFIGPLASPAEPWHYTYTPEAVASK